MRPFGRSVQYAANLQQFAQTHKLIAMKKAHHTTDLPPEGCYQTHKRGHRGGIPARSYRVIEPLVALICVD